VLRQVVADDRAGVRQAGVHSAQGADCAGATVESGCGGDCRVRVPEVRQARAHGVRGADCAGATVESRCRVFGRRVCTVCAARTVPERLSSQGAGSGWVPSQGAGCRVFGRRVCTACGARTVPERLSSHGARCSAGACARCAGRGLCRSDCRVKGPEVRQARVHSVRGADCAGMTVESGCRVRVPGAGCPRFGRRVRTVCGARTVPE